MIRVTVNLYWVTSHDTLHRLIAWQIFGWRPNHLPSYIVIINLCFLLKRYATNLPNISLKIFIITRSHCFDIFNPSVTVLHSKHLLTVLMFFVKYYLICSDFDMHIIWIYTNVQRFHVSAVESDYHPHQAKYVLTIILSVAA